MHKSRFRNIVEATLKEIYNSRFDLDEFSRIPTFKGRIQYCDERLEKLGTGSSRVVYKIDENNSTSLFSSELFTYFSTSR